MAHLCINCNSPLVERKGDTFTCAKCKYVWDVAHEQSNAAYLAAQGRKPATSVLEPVEINNLDAALGLADTPVEPLAGAGALYEVPGNVADAAIESTLSGPVSTTGDDGETTVILREPHPLTGEEADVVERVLGSKTVAELEDIADEAGIDLTDARLKAEKVQVLIESGRVYLADDGETVFVSVEPTDEE